MGTITIGSWIGYLDRGLAPRELEAALLSAGDMTAKECARAMGVSAPTVSKRLDSARFKFGARTVRGLVVELMKQGIIAHCGVLVLALLVGIEHQQAALSRRPETPRRTEMRVASGRTAQEWAA